MLATGSVMRVFSNLHLSTPIYKSMGSYLRMTQKTPAFRAPLVRNAPLATQKLLLA
jgi:hypothetical protein